jgi:hypothetical protein
MKEKANNFINWFEEHFNTLIDITALIGSIFTVLLAIFIFVLGIFGLSENLNSVEYILLPGFIGFMAIIMLFALRITRHLTKK